jgi:hypothetical protein
VPALSGGMDTQLPPLVGLIGKKRSGKDSFAAPLLAEFGFRRVAFAGPLRDAALRLDPWVGPAGLPSWPTPEMHRLTEVIGELGWERAKDHVPGVRETLQRLGTDVVRELDPDFWVRAGARAIEARTAPVVVTDVRFPNEADWVRSRGGILVRIVRPSTDASEDHPTELALEGYAEDLLITNDGTLAELEAHARTLHYRYL